MTRLSRTAAVLMALTLLGAGCGEEEKKAEKKRAPRERADPPARPPPGWRTVSNDSAGFTIAVPRRWSASSSEGRTSLRSDDRLVAVSISADRTARGRELPPTVYARRTIESVEFAGIVDKRISRVRDSRYDNALLMATGTVSPSNLSQRISVAIFHQPGRVSYGVLVFRNAGVKPSFNDRTIDRMLQTFRAQPPSR